MSHQMIEFAANGGTCRGHLAQPEAGSGKGVIVLQEYWGLVPHIQDIANRFAEAGYLALAPDLWNGQVSKDPDDAFRLLMALNIAEAEKQIAGAAAALRAHGASGPVAVVGFCMGGQLALNAACQLGDAVGAVVDFYGIHPKVQPSLAGLSAPVLAIFAKNDGFIPVEKAEALERDIQAAGGRCELHVFDAGHAFFNDTRPSYDKASADAAWALTLEFLGLQLG